MRGLAAFAPEVGPDARLSLLACRTVGVQGDGRSYRSLAAISGAPLDPATGQPDWAQLLAVARKVPSTVHSVNRLVYVFGPALAETHLTEITPTLLTPDALDLLRAADQVVNDALHKHDLVRTLAQVPVILFPCSFGTAGARGIALRPFLTNDFMTGVPAQPGVHIPFAVLDGIVRGIQAIPGVGRVCYDLTAKPPGTTEWE